ncbi:MAG TPA: hypothetical protein VGY55_17130, partial [Pirellulales bacterium]|nr:hypothetical protein [Pirellulales bacterium]
MRDANTSVFDCLFELGTRTLLPAPWVGEGDAAFVGLPDDDKTVIRRLKKKFSAQALKDAGVVQGGSGRSFALSPQLLQNRRCIAAIRPTAGGEISDVLVGGSASLAGQPAWVAALGDEPLQVLIRQWGGTLFVVETMADVLVFRKLGVPAIAAAGLESLTREQTETLRRLFDVDLEVEEQSIRPTVENDAAAMPTDIDYYPTSEQLQKLKKTHVLIPPTDPHRRLPYSDEEIEALVQKMADDFEKNGDGGGDGDDAEDAVGDVDERAAENDDGNKGSDPGDDGFDDDDDVLADEKGVRAEAPELAEAPNSVPLALVLVNFSVAFLDIVDQQSVLNVARHLQELQRSSRLPVHGVCVWKPPTNWIDRLRQVAEAGDLAAAVELLKDDIEDDFVQLARWAEQTSGNGFTQADSSRELSDFVSSRPGHEEDTSPDLARVEHDLVITPLAEWAVSERNPVEAYRRHAFVRAAELTLQKGRRLLGAARGAGYSAEY